MSDLQKPKILVVDDRPENLFMMESVLSDLDAEVHTAASGREALSQCLRHEFAVAFLDVQMPEMDGFETADLMRQGERSRNTPVIFVTAIDRDDRRVLQGYEAGAVDFPYKPVDPDVLRGKAQVFLNLYANRHALEVANQSITKLHAELLQKTKELERHAQQIERQNSRLEEFAYAVSHDLKQPVQSVLDYLELIQSRVGAEQDPKLASWAAAAVGLGGRMQKLVDDLLEFATIGLKPSCFESVNLNSVLESVRGNLQGQIARERARLSHDELPHVTGSPTLLERVFQNLISNAIKYRNPEIDPEIHVSTEQQGMYWLIRVRDNGLGLKAEDLQRIFGIFERVDDHSSVSGSGIGLATCRKIVDVHGGKIWAESEPGRGSSFCFTLPVLGMSAVPQRDLMREPIAL